MARLGPYDGGWFIAEVSGRPTEFDKAGCGGMYVELIKIRWWHPMTWFYAIGSILGTKRDCLKDI